MIFNELYEIFHNLRPHPPYNPQGYFSHHIQGYDFSNLSRGESRHPFVCLLKPFTRSLSVSVLYPGSGSTYRSLTSCYPLPLSCPFPGSFPLSFHHPFTRHLLNPFCDRNLSETLANSNLKALNPEQILIPKLQLFPVNARALCPGQVAKALPAGRQIFQVIARVKPEAI